MTKKDRELLEMMKAFKVLNEKEKGFVFGLAQGFAICKSSIPKNDDDYIINLISNCK